MNFDVMMQYIVLPIIMIISVLITGFMWLNMYWESEPYAKYVFEHTKDVCEGCSKNDGTCRKDGMDTFNHHYRGKYKVWMCGERKPKLGINRNV